MPIVCSPLVQENPLRHLGPTLRDLGTRRRAAHINRTWDPRRKGERERTPLAEDALDPNPPTVEFDELLRQR